MRTPDPVVLDASALLAYLQDEPGADAVEALLATGNVWMNLVNLGAITSIVERGRGSVAADQLFVEATNDAGFGEQPPLHWAPLGPPLVREAARLKAAGGLSFAGAFAAATAILLEAEVVVLRHDAEFEVAAERGVRVRWIG
ncbi:MAG: PIN domain-containing protein [Candidatus Dormibacteraceae bacterium]